MAYGDDLPAAAFSKMVNGANVFGFHVTIHQEALAVFGHVIGKNVGARKSERGRESGTEARACRSRKCFRR